MFQKIKKDKRNGSGRTDGSIYQLQPREILSLLSGACITGSNEKSSLNSDIRGYQIAIISSFKARALNHIQNKKTMEIFRNYHEIHIFIECSASKSSIIISIIIN